MLENLASVGGRVVHLRMLALTAMLLVTSQFPFPLCVAIINCNVED